MKNFVKPGNSLPIVAHKDLKSGDFVKIGGLSGIAQGDAKTGAPVEIHRCGVFRLPKGNEAWTVGQKLYWDDDAGQCTTVEAENDLIGISTSTQPTSSKLAPVYLDGVIR